MSQILAGCCCCNDDGALWACVKDCQCQLLKECDCKKIGGTFYRNQKCDDLVGSCCLPDGSCINTICPDDCTRLGGNYRPGQPCDPQNPCNRGDPCTGGNTPLRYAVEWWGILDRTWVCTSTDPCLDGVMFDSSCYPLTIRTPRDGMGNYPSCNVLYDDFIQVYEPNGTGNLITLRCGETQIFFSSDGCITTLSFRCQQQCVKGLCCYDVSESSNIYNSGSYISGFCLDSEYPATVCGLPHWVTAYAALGPSDPRCKP